MPYVVAMPVGSPFKNVEELVEFAKASELRDFKQR